MLYKNYANKFCAILLMVLILLLGNTLISSADTNGSSGQGGIRLNRYTYNPIGIVPPTATTYLPWYASAGIKTEFFDNSGNYNIVYESDDKENINIARLDNKFSVIDTLIIKKELPIFGNAVCDRDGNYYILYGKHVDETEKEAKNVIVAKYDSNGQKTNVYAAEASRMSFMGTKEPFHFANASMAINGNVLVAFFGRVMFKSNDGLNHQSSTVLYIDKTNMTLLGLPIPYNSHSFDQQVIPTTEGGFLFVDRGDAYARGFKLTKLSGNRLSSFEAFHFRETTVYQNTLSTLGGIAENTSGYALVGTSDKVLSNTAVDSKDANSQNLFIQVVKKDFDKYAADSDRMVSSGTVRESEGISNSTGLNRTGGVSYFLPPLVRDYGVVWLTDYTGSTNAVNPKMVSLSNGNCAILWEKWEKEKFVETNLILVDGSGNIIMPATVIPKAGLCRDERLLVKNGEIFWSVSDGSTITTYSLDVNNTSISNNVVNVSPLLVSKITFDKNELSLSKGCRNKLNYSLSSQNADDKSLSWVSSDPSIAKVDENGYVSALEIGKATITVKSKDGGASASCNLIVEPTRITFYEAAATIPKGFYYTTSYDLPSNYEGEKFVQWSSTNPSVAKVDTSGKVSALTEGTATISLKSKDGRSSASYDVTVVPLVPTATTKVYKYQMNLNLGKEFMINANKSELIFTHMPDKIGLNDVFISLTDSDGKVHSSQYIKNRTDDRIVFKIKSDTSANGDILQKGVYYINFYVNNRGDGAYEGYLFNKSVQITYSTDDTYFEVSSSYYGKFIIPSLVLSKNNINIKNGNSHQLTVRTSPSDGGQRSFKWESSDTKVANVDKSGKVTSVAPGTATITATVQDESNITSACVVTVTPILVSNVSLNMKNVTITKGNSYQLVATISPSNADNRNLTWESSDTKVATVDKNGMVTSVVPGKVTITATAQDESKITSACEIIVAPQLVTVVNLNMEKVTITNGSKYQLSATILPDNADNRDLTWESSNKVVATVDKNGIVTSVAPGTATITATAQDESKITSACAIVVAPLLVSDISLNKKNITLTKGSIEQLSATISPDNADNRKLDWKSSNKNVAIVDKNGKVTAVSVGKARISAIAQDDSKLTSVCEVTVSPLLVSKISLNMKSITIIKGRSYQLTARISPSNADNKRLTWTSSNSKVATVGKDGKILAIAKGTTTIKVTTVNGSKIIETCKITVK